MFGAATQNGVGIGIGNIPTLTSLPYSVQLNLAVQQLFASGEPGLWLDPSDLSTMYQDSAGTTPVTAVEQPVGRINDKSGRGCNFTQSTAGVRPVLSARVNLLTKTEDLTIWSKQAGQGTPVAITSPDGTNTAFSLPVSAGGSIKQLYRAASSATTATTNYIVAKAGTASWLGFAFDGTAITDGAFFNLANGTVGTVAAGTTVGISPLGSGWYICTIARVLASAAHNSILEVHTADNQATTWTAAGTETIQVWHPDFRPSDQATGLIPTYQRVNTSTDYDTAGFPLYLSGNGTQWMQCASQDYTGVNKMLVAMGTRKLSSAVGLQYLLELSAISSSNAGSYVIYINPPANDYRSGLYGAAAVGAVYGGTTYTAPITNTLLTLFDLAGANIAAQIIPKVNNATPTLSALVAGPSGAGNFGNYPAYLFGRGGASNFFTGNIYQLIARGSTVASNAAQIAATENWTDLKTRAY